ncbi:stage II sporulation protein D [Paenibacillus sp. Y412MC10]|uniref:stage II sporulation protein D n=2 Tax=Paenibacillus TaxID=44249 RepID=UPI00119E95CD|nr:stage II sporulation protein D [Paenibacillus sp. Y412MC10]
MKDPRTQLKIPVAPRSEALTPDDPRSTAPQPGRPQLTMLPGHAAQPPEAAAPARPERQGTLRPEAPGAPGGARHTPGRRPWTPPPSRGPAKGPRRPGSARKVPPAALWGAGGVLALALLLPTLVVVSTNHHPAPVPAPIPAPAPAKPAAPQAEAQLPNVSVYLTKTGQVEVLPMEDYVTGVLAAEMPADFELEALKAQAIAARTFIVRRLVDGDMSGVPDRKAMVTDTVSHQAYISKEVLEKEWKAQGKSAELAKLQRAVQETRNTIMTYKGKPITASFFSTSNGYTENSEDYWKEDIPYLRSVGSPWDKELSPGYKETVTISRKDFITKLGLAGQAITVSTGQPFIQVLSTTEGHRIKEISIGGHVFSGREVREKLNLRSSEFTWKTSGADIQITTYGYGHGVGMSQWGADGMAKEGSTATQILKHYYTGIDFTQASKLLSKD